MGAAYLPKCRRYHSEHSAAKAEDAKQVKFHPLGPQGICICKLHFWLYLHMGLTVFRVDVSLNDSKYLLFLKGKAGDILVTTSRAESNNPFLFGFLFAFQRVSLW